MKTKLILISTTLFCVFSNAQSLKERVANTICEKFDAYTDIEKVQNELRDVTKQLLLKQNQEVSNSDLKAFLDEEFTDILMDHCEHLRILFVEDKEDAFYNGIQSSETKNLLQKGDDLIDEGNYDQAIITFKKIIDKYYVNLKAFNQIAYCYTMKDNQEIAIEYYNKTLSYFEADLEALFNKGVLFGMKNDMKQAKTTFDSLMYYHPKEKSSYYIFSVYYFQLGDYETALNYAFQGLNCAKDRLNNSKPLHEITVYTIKKLKEAGKELVVETQAKQYGVALDQFKTL